MLKKLNNLKFSFSVRKGYGCEELFIEFKKGSGTNEMVESLKKALSSLDPFLIKKEDIWMNDEMFYHFDSIAGPYSISYDIWDSIFILANNNQEAIPKIETALLDSGLFEKE